MMNLEVKAKKSILSACASRGRLGKLQGWTTFLLPHQDAERLQLLG